MKITQSSLIVMFILINTFLNSAIPSADSINVSIETKYVDTPIWGLVINKYVVIFVFSILTIIFAWWWIANKNKLWKNLKYKILLDSLIFAIILFLFFPSRFGFGTSDPWSITYYFSTWGLEIIKECSIFCEFQIIYLILFMVLLYSIFSFILIFIIEKMKIRKKNEKK